jgi:hypothetical protein
MHSTLAAITPERFGQMKYIGHLTILTIVLLTSCGVPKEVLDKLSADKKVMVDFPTDYYVLMPRLDFAHWDKDYNEFNKFLTQDIMRTQMWMGYNKNGVDIAFCANAARTHVQLDTSSLITNKKQIIGQWRAISNRRIVFIDSAVHSEKKIYRRHETLYDEKDTDVFLVLTDSKLTMYGTEKGSDKYKKLPSKNYSLQNGRFLLGYGLAKAGGGISFVGLDKEGQLIFNWQTVEERKVKGVYVTYQSVMTQLILRKV